MKHLHPSESESGLQSSEEQRDLLLRALHMMLTLPRWDPDPKTVANRYHRFVRQHAWVVIQVVKPGSPRRKKISTDGEMIAMMKRAGTPRETPT